MDSNNDDDDDDYGLKSDGLRDTVTESVAERTRLTDSMTEGKLKILSAETGRGLISCTRCLTLLCSICFLFQ